jgi:hypothetical protein
MLILALLLIVVPVILLLVAFGVIPADLINQYTGYRSGLEALGNLQVSDFSQQVRTIIFIISVVVALLALILLLRELSFGRRVARDTVVEDTPGQETVIKTSAVKSLVEGAARETGAISPSAGLSSEGRPYNVYCKIQVPQSGNFVETASRARESIQNALNRYNVPYKEVEVTVQGTES